MKGTKASLTIANRSKRIAECPIKSLILQNIEPEIKKTQETMFSIGKLEKEDYNAECTDQDKDEI